MKSQRDCGGVRKRSCSNVLGRKNKRTPLLQKRNVKDRDPSISVLINDNYVGALREGGSLKCIVEPGKHTISVTNGSSTGTGEVVCGNAHRVKLWFRLASGRLEISDNLDD